MESRRLAKLEVCMNILAYRSRPTESWTHLVCQRILVCHCGASMPRYLCLPRTASAPTRSCLPTSYDANNSLLLLEYKRDTSPPLLKNLTLYFLIHRPGFGAISTDICKWIVCINALGDMTDYSARGSRKGEFSPYPCTLHMHIDEKSPSLKARPFR